MKRRWVAGFLLFAFLCGLTACGAPEEIMIAPALDPAAVEPVYDLESTDSVYVPELGAATGFRFYSEHVPEGLTIYSLVKNVTAEEAVALIDEYFYFLASLPYFEIQEQLRVVSSGRGYTGVLTYTGTGRVIPGDDSHYNGVAYAVDFYYYPNDRELFIQYAEGLKLVDTGLRLSGADHSAQQVYGPHICDAFYECGGSYYSSDHMLVAKSGQCAILLNGESYIGNTEASGTVRFFVEAFHRSDWIEIFLEKNYPVDEDIYNRSQLLQYKTSSIGTVTKDDTVVFSVSSNNGEDWNQPRPRQNDDFDGISIRVLQWEPEGDIVLYFYADLYLDNEPYEIEGLLVTNPVANEEKKAGQESDKGGSTSDTDQEKTCSACGGSGNCNSCRGSGYITQWIAQKQERMPCASCATSGNCAYCNGKGKT